MHALHYRYNQLLAPAFWVMGVMATATGMWNPKHKKNNALPSFYLIYEHAQAHAEILVTMASIKQENGGCT